jgi:hypothetical protein
LKLIATIKAPARNVTAPTIAQNWEPVMKLPSRTPMPCSNHTRLIRDTILPMKGKMDWRLIKAPLGVERLLPIHEDEVLTEVIFTSMIGRSFASV